MWTLIVLIVGTLPPQGIAIEGFPNKATCVEEARNYCENDTRYKCKCIVFTPDM
jgi:hypothetical protein